MNKIKKKLKTLNCFLKPRQTENAREHVRGIGGLGCVLVN